jgi:large subunit ribosomal protein L25
MSDLEVKATERTELGKNASRRIRRSGKIPVVVYGRGIDSVSLTLDPRDLLHVLHSEHGRNTIFRVNYGEISQEVLIRDIQLDPVRGNLMHADLQKVAMDQAMTFEVPIELIGSSPGVELGGQLEAVTREVEIECLPGDVPETIEVDISKLEIGDNIRVADLQIDSAKITMLTDENVVLVAVVPPAAEEEEEVEEVSEPEVIQKGKVEDGAAGESD